LSTVIYDQYKYIHIGAKTFVQLISLVYLKFELYAVNNNYQSKTAEVPVKINGNGN